MYILKKSGIRKFLMFCMIAIFASCISINVSTFAQAETKQGTISASSKTVERGDKFSITMSLKDNPGIWGLKLKVSYDHSALTLTSAKNGTIFDDEDAVIPSTLDKDEFIYLAYCSSLKDNTQNGTVLTLEFTAKDTAEFKPYIIGVNVEQAINVKSEDITLNANDGAVSVVKCIHVNDSKWDSDADTHWHNCVYSDCKEKIMKTVEKHTARVIPEVKATCEKSGLSAGMKCSICGYIIQKQKVVKAKGHTPVVIPAVKATTERSGLTKGKKCKVCGKILVAQKKIPKLAKTPKVTYTVKKPATTNKRIKMYQKMSKTSKVLKTIKKGEKVTIVDIKKGWYLIKYKNKVGYVKSTLVTWKGTIKLQDGSLRLRSGAGRKYSIITSLANGTTVDVIGNNKIGWYKVRINKVEGYMASKFIK